MNRFMNLPKWKKYGLAAIVSSVLFAVVFFIVSGEPVMALAGLLMGAISGPAAARWSERLS